MLSPLFNLALLAILVCTLVCITDWLFRHVLGLPVKRPLAAAAATLALATVTVAPAVAGIDALVGEHLTSISRALLAVFVAVLQTAIVVRLAFGGSLPMAFAHGLILQLTWGAVSVLVVLCDRLGGFYGAAPLVFILVAYITRKTQDRDLKRRLSSVPPSAPSAPPAMRVGRGA